MYYLPLRICRAPTNLSPLLQKNTWANKPFLSKLCLTTATVPRTHPTVILHHITRSCVGGEASGVSEPPSLPQRSTQLTPSLSNKSKQVMVQQFAQE